MVKLKYSYLLLLLFLVLFSCKEDNNDELEERLSNLEDEVELLRKQAEPGLGDLMLRIQNHHAKLWFAGINENWELTGHQLHELEETFERMESLEHRKEAKHVKMIYEPIEKLEEAQEKRNVKLFKKGYKVLTNTCNSCHEVTDHQFNIIKTPDSPPVSNQEF